MRVTRIATLGFRNLADADLDLDPGVTVLWGLNGAGKTNALEALACALAGRSPRTRTEREIIRFGDPVARCEAEVQDGTERRRFLFATERSGERRHLLDGAAAGATATLALRPSLSLFMPDRLALVKGPPADRRANLDRFVAALWPTRVEASRRYRRALAQRNALLGRVRAGSAAPDSLDAWEEELATAGLELIEVRGQATAALASPFREAAAELGLDEAVISYRPRSRAADAAELAAELAERRPSDLERGFTAHGPHLDDLALERGGRSLRRYGSQGQQRLALLALLFAERHVLAEGGRPQPLLLLDDVASELDPSARRRLVALLERTGGQALVTATEAEHLPAGERERTEIELRAGSAAQALDPKRPSAAGLAAA